MEPFLEGSASGGQGLALAPEQPIHDGLRKERSAGGAP